MTWFRPAPHPPFHAAVEHGRPRRTLEISSRSSDRLGRDLSAMNLPAAGDPHRRSVEAVYQAAKCYGDGGPDTRVSQSGYEAKCRDPERRRQGPLAGFRHEGRQWPPETGSAFYDWLWTRSALRHRRTVEHGARGAARPADDVAGRLTADRDRGRQAGCPARRRDMAGPARHRHHAVAAGRQRCPMGSGHDLGAVGRGSAGRRAHGLGLGTGVAARPVPGGPPHDGDRVPGRGQARRFGTKPDTGRRDLEGTARTLNRTAGTRALEPCHVATGGRPARDRPCANGSRRPSWPSTRHGQSAAARVSERPAGGM